MPNEADTCRRYIVPLLQLAGWDEAPHRINEQVAFTDGRVIVTGRTGRRRPGKRADYLLRLRPDFAIAVIEAKASYRNPGDGLQQAKEYAEILGLKFAYSTNGHGIIEYDFTTGLERGLDRFPTPEELWARYAASEGIAPEITDRLLAPFYDLSGKHPRYYQEIAINRVVQSVLQGVVRILLTMATGTGKTFVAFQICWKLWSTRWNRTGEYRRPRILYLADRNILVDDPKEKEFAPFEEARVKIGEDELTFGRELYFAIYQAIAQDERRPGLYRQFPRDFFDLIIIDECHRGSARDDSNWREILDYYEPAYKLGMTATPRRLENINTYLYFGNPVYTYSLRQGIEDGFLAPYRVHRIVTQWDAVGWRPTAGEIDRYGREIPDELYQTPEFERIISLRARSAAVARHLTAFLKRTDRFAKTIVFCVDQEHAEEMRGLLNNLNTDLTRQFPDYVCRIVSDEGKIGRGFLSRFKDVETDTPVIATTSQMLTTGVNIPTCRNIVLLRPIHSMTEFKQIIGRGTRVRDDYGKLFFNILDYTGSATRLFADPEFDGEPEEIIEDTADSPEPGEPDQPTPEDDPQPPDAPGLPPDRPDDPPRKFYYDRGQVDIVAEVAYDLDAYGKQLRVVQLSDYTAEQVRTLFVSSADLQQAWADPEQRAEVIEKLADRGIDFEELARAINQPEADPFDLLCHLAFDAPLRTRAERARQVRSGQQDFWQRYGPEARAILEELLDKYAAHGDAQFALPDVLEVPPISHHGNILQIAEQFGGEEALTEAVSRLQILLYSVP